MEKVKKIAKYLVNALNMINALILVLSPIWNWHLDLVSQTIIGVAGVISAYLVGGKLWNMEDSNENNT